VRTLNNYYGTTTATLWRFWIYRVHVILLIQWRARVSFLSLRSHFVCIGFDNSVRAILDRFFIVQIKYVNCLIGTPTITNTLTSTYDDFLVRSPVIIGKWIIFYKFTLQILIVETENIDLFGIVFWKNRFNDTILDSDGRVDYTASIV